MRRCVLAGVVVFCTARASFAYRPFDGTDAAVAGRGELEIELGPAGFLKLGADRFLVAPALIANLGFAERWELLSLFVSRVRRGSTEPSCRDRVGGYTVCGRIAGEVDYTLISDYPESEAKVLLAQLR